MKEKHIQECYKLMGEVAEITVKYSALFKVIDNMKESGMYHENDDVLNVVSNVLHEESTTIKDINALVLKGLDKVFSV